MRKKRQRVLTEDDAMEISITLSQIRDFPCWLVYLGLCVAAFRHPRFRPPSLTQSRGHSPGLLSTAGVRSANRCPVFAEIRIATCNPSPSPSSADAPLDLVFAGAAITPVSLLEWS